MTAHRPNQKGGTFQLGKGTRQGIHQTQGNILVGTCDQNAGYHQTVLRHDGCLPHCLWRDTHAKGL